MSKARTERCKVACYDQAGDRCCSVFPRVPPLCASEFEPGKQKVGCFACYVYFVFYCCRLLLTSLLMIACRLVLSVCERSLRNPSALLLYVRSFIPRLYLSFRSCSGTKLDANARAAIRKALVLLKGKEAKLTKASEAREYGSYIAGPRDDHVGAIYQMAAIRASTAAHFGLPDVYDVRKHAVVLS